jgi:hypothetical protein
MQSPITITWQAGPDAHVAVVDAYTIGQTNLSTRQDAF